MGKDRSGGESPLQGLKGFASLIRKIPFDAFACKSSERNDNVGVVGDESPVEIGEA